MIAYKEQGEYSGGGSISLPQVSLSLILTHQCRAPGKEAASTNVIVIVESIDLVSMKANQLLYRFINRGGLWKLTRDVFEKVQSINILGLLLSTLHLCCESRNEPLI